MNGMYVSGSRPPRDSEAASFFGRFHYLRVKNKKCCTVLEIFNSELNTVPEKKCDALELNLDMVIAEIKYKIFSV